MEEGKKETDLKSGDEQFQEEKPQEGESTSEETTPEVVQDDLKQKESEAIADELLSDGTPKRKEIRVKYDTFKEVNEKAKLYDSFEPLLSKLKEKPEVVDSLFEGKKETTEDRLTRLEEERKDDKRKEMKTVITEAITIWPDVQSRWQELRPLVEALEKQGLSYKEAFQRAYFAINPDAVRRDERLIEKKQAQDEQNRMGTFSFSSGATKVIHEDEENQLAPEDHEFIQIMKAKGVMIDPKLYQKHAKSISR